MAIGKNSYRWLLSLFFWGQEEVWTFCQKFHFGKLSWVRILHLSHLLLYTNRPSFWAVYIKMMPCLKKFFNSDRRMQTISFFLPLINECRFFSLLKDGLIFYNFPFITFHRHKVFVYLSVCSFFLYWAVQRSVLYMLLDSIMQFNFDYKDGLKK